MQTVQHFQQEEIKPLVSFIIPCFNTPAELLQKCVDSITELSLAIDEREIIIVDDGSEVPAIGDLLLYRDDIIYIRKKNGGLSHARNMGIRMATGEYIQFVDSDDYLSKTAYEHCLDIIRFMRPEMVMFDASRKEADCIEFKDSEFMSGSEYMSSHNLQIMACGYIFKRDVMGSLRFPLGLYHEDEDFTPQLLLRVERMIRTDAKAYIYIKRENSITTAADRRSVIKRLNDLEMILLNLQEKSIGLPLLERKALERRVAQLTMDYIYNIIVQTRSSHQLEKRIELLKRHELFPLPDRNYTQKYKWFRKMANSSIGRKMLLNTLPIMKRYI